MRMRDIGVWSALVTVFISVPVQAQDTVVTGIVVQTQGHVQPACRMVEIRLTDGSLTWFRIPAVSNNDDGILAVTLTALSTGKTVDIGYIPGNTTGCGTEPAIAWISIHSGN